jgi:hypothetical protein
VIDKRAVVFGIANAAVLVFASAGAHSDSIGDVVSIVPAANYQRGKLIQELQLNGLLEQNDRVITTGDGSAYLHFIDDTVLTVGANSEVVLDKFVFDGDRAKTATVQLVRGTLRFVTGISSHNAYQIKTPVATIGVRGTTIDTSYENDRMVFNTVDGLGVVCPTNATCQDIRAGSAPVAITHSGFARATPAEAARMLNTLNRAHTRLAQRIGRNPGSMLAFARSRGPGLGRGPQGQKGLLRKGFDQKGEKGFGKKEFQPKYLKDENLKLKTKRRDEKRLRKGKRF